MSISTYSEWTGQATSSLCHGHWHFEGLTSVPATLPNLGSGAGALTPVAGPTLTAAGGTRRGRGIQCSTTSRAFVSGMNWNLDNRWLVGGWFTWPAVTTELPLFDTNATSGQGRTVALAVLASTSSNFTLQARLYDSTSTLRATVNSPSFAKTIPATTPLYVGVWVDFTRQTLELHVGSDTTWYVTSATIPTGYTYLTSRADLELSFRGSPNTFGRAGIYELVIARGAVINEVLTQARRAARCTVLSNPSLTVSATGTITNTGSTPATFTTIAIPGLLEGGTRYTYTATGTGVTIPAVSTSAYPGAVLFGDEYTPDYNGPTWDPYEDLARYEGDLTIGASSGSIGARWAWFTVRLEPGGSATRAELTLAPAILRFPDLVPDYTVPRLTLIAQGAYDPERDIPLERYLSRCVTYDDSNLASTLEFTLELPQGEDLIYKDASGNFITAPVSRLTALMKVEQHVQFQLGFYTIKRINIDYHRPTTSGPGGVASLTPRVSVYCERIWYDLLYQGSQPERMFSGSASDQLKEILKGSPWYAGGVDRSTMTWTRSEDTCLGALHQMANASGLYLYIDDRTRQVHLRGSSGQDTGIGFGEENIESISLESDSSGLITSVIGTTENGLVRVEQTNTAYTRVYKVSNYRYQNDMSREAILPLVQANLARLSRITETATWKIRNLHLLKPSERFRVGDMVYVSFPEVRRLMVTSMTVDYMDLSQSEVTLGGVPAKLGFFDRQLPR